MNMKRIFLLGILCLSLFFLYGCREQNKGSKDGVSYDENKKTEDNVIKEESSNELEQLLTEYRKQREENIKMKNGILIGKGPNEENFKEIFNDEVPKKPKFDTREMRKAFETAGKYVTENLGIAPKTKLTVYDCVDPRINSIYEDEDKGVAKGYENENIFICEYDNNEKYQYIILVRDSKEGMWRVIHHGNSYQKNKKDK